MFRSIFAAGVLALYAGSATAATEPFALDDLLGSASQSEIDALCKGTSDCSGGGSSENAEIYYLATEFGLNYDDLLLFEKFESGDILYNGIAEEDDTASYYFDIDPDTVGWFILKFGDGGNDNTNVSHYFFENIADLTKLVWSDFQTDGALSACRSGENSLYAIGDVVGEIGSCRLSHITTVVPLPAAGWLLLGGLGGLAAMRRRNKV